jgi:hypothetical protein
MDREGRWSPSEYGAAVQTVCVFGRWESAWKRGDRKRIAHLRFYSKVLLIRTHSFLL